MPRQTTAVHDLDSLAAIRKRIEDVAARTGALQESMTQAGCKELELTNQSDLMIGLQRIEAWVDAGHRCVRRWIEAKGLYRSRSSRPIGKMRAKKES